MIQKKSTKSFNHIKPGSDMFKTYLKTALRNLQRHKSNSFINIAGLVVGFAAFLLIFLVVQYQESFDNFHANKDQVYRIVRIG